MDNYIQPDQGPRYGGEYVLNSRRLL